jgi:hypothetical protein
MCPQTPDLLDGKLLLCPIHQSLYLQLENRRYALYEPSPECDDSCGLKLVGEAEALEVTGLTERQLLEAIWHYMSGADPNSLSGVGREIRLMCEERLGWSSGEEDELIRFDETTVTDPQEAVDILFGDAIKAVPKAIEQRIPSEGLWGSPPVSGTDSELKALILEELRSYLNRDTFDSYVIRANSGDDFAQVMASLGTTFAPIRLWRTRDSFHACGGPDFGANRIAAHQPAKPVQAAMEAGGAASGPSASATPIDDRLHGIQDINSFIFSERDRLMAGDRSRDDSTMVVWELLNEYKLYRGMILFEDFETAKSVLFDCLEGDTGLTDAVAGLSKTSDGAAMVIGGDLRSARADWLDMMEGLNRRCNELGITKAVFFEMGSSKPTEQGKEGTTGEPADEGSPHFEVGLPEGDGSCSDNACPCDDEVIPRGEGYLYIPPDMVDFRRDALSHAEVRAKILRMREEGLARGDMTVVDPALYNPVLMCRLAAMLRGLDLEVAAQDAKIAWETDWAPLRPTPLATKESTPPSRKEKEALEKEAPADVQPSNNPTRETEAAAKEDSAHVQPLKFTPRERYRRLIIQGQFFFLDKENIKGVLTGLFFAVVAAFIAWVHLDRPPSPEEIVKIKDPKSLLALALDETWPWATPKEERLARFTAVGLLRNLPDLEKVVRHPELTHALLTQENDYELLRSYTCDKSINPTIRKQASIRLGKFLDEIVDYSELQCVANGDFNDDTRRLARKILRQLKKIGGRIIDLHRIFGSGSKFNQEIEKIEVNISIAGYRSDVMFYNLIQNYEAFPKEIKQHLYPHITDRDLQKRILLDRRNDCCRELAARSLRDSQEAAHDQEVAKAIKELLNP